MSENQVVATSVALDKPAYDPALFHSISQQTQANYAANVDPNAPLFRVEIPKGKLFETYLANLPESIRQQMNCACCRSFLNRSGGLVRISTDEATFGQLESVFWRHASEEHQHDPVFSQAIEAMRKLVESSTVGYHFLSNKVQFGEFEQGGFEHFAVKNAQVFEHELYEPHEVIATEMQAYNNLAKFIGTSKQELIDQALVYFKNHSVLKTRDKWVGHLEWLASFKRRWEELPKDLQRPYAWLQVATQSPGRVDLKNSPLGKFIKNVAGGDSYDIATKKFLEMTKGENYMRATAAPKAGNVQRAEVIFEKLGLASALERRPLALTEVRGSIWTPPVVEKPVEEKKPLFGHLEARDAKPALPAKVEVDHGPITLKRFIEEVLPEAEELYFEFRNPYQGRYNIGGFMTAVHADAKPILMWDQEDNRNPASGYLYAQGSTPAEWALTNEHKVKIVNIAIDINHWASNAADVKPYVFGEHNVIFFFEKGYDTRLVGTPMFPETFRPELHEVRSVLESFFRTKEVTPLQNGEQPAVGLLAPRNGPTFIPLLVVKKDAIVRYQIDRSH